MLLFLLTIYSIIKIKMEDDVAKKQMFLYN